MSLGQQRYLYGPEWDVSNTCFIGNIFGVTSTGGAGVFVNGNGPARHGRLLREVQEGYCHHGKGK